MDQPDDLFLSRCQIFKLRGNRELCEGVLWRVRAPWSSSGGLECMALGAQSKAGEAPFLIQMVMVDGICGLGFLQFVLPAVCSAAVTVFPGHVGCLEEDFCSFLHQRRRVVWEVQGGTNVVTFVIGSVRCLNYPEPLRVAFIVDFSFRKSISFRLHSLPVPCSLILSLFLGLPLFSFSVFSLSLCSLLCRLSFFCRPLPLPVQFSPPLLGTFDIRTAFSGSIIVVIIEWCVGGLSLPF